MKAKQTAHHSRERDLAINCAFGKKPLKWELGVKHQMGQRGAEGAVHVQLRALQQDNEWEYQAFAPRLEKNIDGFSDFGAEAAYGDSQGNWPETKPIKAAESPSFHLEPAMYNLAMAPSISIFQTISM